MTKTQLTIHMPAKKSKLWCNPKNFHRFVDRLPPCVIHCFTGNREQAIKYLQVYFESLSFSWHTCFLSIFSSSIMSAKINFIIASYAHIFLMLIKISFFTKHHHYHHHHQHHHHHHRHLHISSSAATLGWLATCGRTSLKMEYAESWRRGSVYFFYFIQRLLNYLHFVFLFWLQLIALVDLILFETAGDPVGQAPGGNRRSLHVSWPTLWESHAATNITKDHNDKRYDGDALESENGNCLLSDSRLIWLTTYDISW